MLQLLAFGHLLLSGPCLFLSLARLKFGLHLLFDLLFDLEVQLLGHACKYLLYVVASLCTGFEHPLDPLLLGEVLSSLYSHFTFVFHFGFVTDQVHTHIFGRVLLDFSQPFQKIHKGLFPGHVVSKEHTVRSSVEYARY